MPDSCVIEAEKPSPAGASRDPASRFPAVIALAFALAFALVLLLDAGRAVPMLERQAVAFDWPWLRPVAAGLRSVAEASGLAALSGMESLARMADWRDARARREPRDFPFWREVCASRARRGRGVRHIGSGRFRWRGRDGFAVFCPRD